jgi:hypothetical protein
MDNIERKNWGGEECPITLFMEQIGGKWKPVILWLLFQEGTMRFSELDKSISGITQRCFHNSSKGWKKQVLLSGYLIRLYHQKSNTASQKKVNRYLVFSTACVSGARTIFRVNK